MAPSGTTISGSLPVMAASTWPQNGRKGVNEDAGWLYQWASLGVPVTVYHNSSSKDQVANAGVARNPRGRKNLWVAFLTWLPNLKVVELSEVNGGVPPLEAAGVFWNGLRMVRK